MDCWYTGTRAQNWECLGQDDIEVDGEDDYDD
jgi:hypothetical protein